uniref:DUF2478 domain-containing protein n=1 Tax=Roseovarius halophilus (ex Wu et al. 2025) TaxID=3376060 RepID=UPI003999878A
MNLAYVMTRQRGATDRLLSGFAADCTARGLALTGVVQTNTDCTDARLCDMDVRVLPHGPEFRISQSLGPGARGCRLDPAALEEAVAAVEHGLDRRPDLLIVNKFGKHEAEGRGFREVIARCLAADVPVLTGVNARNLDAFLDFSAGMARALDPDPPALRAWVAALPARGD